MKLGELRRLLADLPDDADIFVDMGDLQFHEVRLRYKLPPVLDHSYAVILEMGQVWNAEYDLDMRLDALF